MNPQKDLSSSNPAKRLEAIETIEKTNDIKHIPKLLELVQKEQDKTVREKAQKAIRALLEDSAILAERPDLPEESTVKPQELSSQLNSFYIPKKRSFRWAALVALALYLLIAFIVTLIIGPYLIVVRISPSNEEQSNNLSTATAAAALLIPTITPEPTSTELQTTCLEPDAEDGISISDFTDYENHPYWSGSTFSFKNGEMMSIPYESAFNVGQDDFSFTIHYQVDIASSNYHVLFDRSSEPPELSQGISLYFSQGRLTLELADAQITHAFMSDIPMTARDWQTVTITVDRDDADGGKFYVDGSLEYTFNPTNHRGSLSARVPLHVGGNMLIDSGFNGNIAILEFFPCIVLSEEEIIRQATAAHSATAEE